MAPTLITTHEADAVARLVQQFRAKPNIEALVGAIGARAQTLEGELWRFIAAFDLDTSTGAQLDMLGATVGELRNGRTDADFRVFVRARVLLNRSSGTLDEINSLLDMVLAVLGGNAFDVTEWSPATIITRIHDALTVDPSLMVELLKQARAGGVRGLMVYSGANDDATFTFGERNPDDSTPTDAAVGFSSTSTPETGGSMAGVVEA